MFIRIIEDEMECQINPNQTDTLTHTHRKTDTQTDKHTDRQTEKRTDRKKEKLRRGDNPHRQKQ